MHKRWASKNTGTPIFSSLVENLLKNIIGRLILLENGPLWED